MNISTITSTWDAIIQYFFPVFTAPTAEVFLSLVYGEGGVRYRGRRFNEDFTYSARDIRFTTKG
jgi:hypothetical protein